MNSTFDFTYPIKCTVRECHECYITCAHSQITQTVRFHMIESIFIFLTPKIT